MAILDTNVLLRYLTEDNPEQATRALAILERIEAGSLTVTLPEGVLVEAVQVLSSKRLYNVPREVIRTCLGAIVRLPAVQMVNKRTYLRAFDVYIESPQLSFVDALCVPHAKRTDDPTVITFDRGFRAIPDINWLEP